MSTASHKEIVRRYCHELFTQGQLEAANELLTEDFIFHGPFGVVTGREEFKRFVSMLRQAFADFHMVDEMDIGEGDWVASRFTMSGVHRGDYHGIPATGQPMSVSGIDVFRFSEGKIAEVGAVIDSLRLMQQLGVVAIQA